jgi:hypothetical protein
MEAGGERRVKLYERTLFAIPSIELGFDGITELQHMGRRSPGAFVPGQAV